MIKYLYVPILFLFASCDIFENHSHDGKYYTVFTVFGGNIVEIFYEINGRDLSIDNSATGTSKFSCKQYHDRVEYTEPDGTIRVLYVMGNGDIKLNDNFILAKIDKDKKQ